MDYCVIALLDALGSGTAHKIEHPDVLVHRWDNFDNNVEWLLNEFKSQLGKKGYDKRVVKHGPYDNLQIAIPVTTKEKGLQNMTSSGPLWWTIQSVGEIMICLFRYGLSNALYLRGCISAGKYYQTTKERILGDAASEAANLYEKAEWLGIVASPSAAMVLNSANAEHQAIFDIFVRHSINSKDTSFTSDWVVNWANQSLDRNGIQNSLLNSLIEEKVKEAQNRLTELGRRCSNETCKLAAASSVLMKWSNTLDFYNKMVG